jgi:D-alanine transaminase
MSSAQVYLDGHFLPLTEARVSVEDRGFLFGDGVYEVLRASAGRLYEEEAHWRRLASSCREVALTLPEGLPAGGLRALALELLARNGLGEGEATVYLQLTRGAAPRTHHFPPPGTRPTLYLSAAAFAPPWEARTRGVQAITLPDVRWSRCNIKSINLLPNTLAKQRAREAGAAEAVFVRDGVLTEGASTTVFAVLDGALVTHPNGPHILPGVTRDVVLALARAAGIPVHERPLRLEEREHFDELFVASTTLDLAPVVALDGQPVGAGRPGPVTRALQQAFYAAQGVTPPTLG